MRERENRGIELLLFFFHLRIMRGDEKERGREGEGKRRRGGIVRGEEKVRKEGREKDMRQKEGWERGTESEGGREGRGREV